MAEQNLEQSIFLHAIGLAEPADRAAYLDEACRDIPALRVELDALLAAHGRLGDVPPPRFGPAATETFTPPPESGTVIGPYKLIEQIGEGGMGTVWMAQQAEPVKRLVAVKLIKAGMDSRQVIARFEAERQALALMDHPNIARVLDAGTTDSGRPYFVMDLVRGVPITRYCDEHHLTPRQRLELFIPVCQAIQHAHQKGIIHRDLKPSNVLVALYDGKPVPKVIDFGVAKAAGQPLTEQTLVTGFGNIVGTLEYMSPEQAEINQLDIDTRSDIYALGVLLYELLTGSPPFSRKELEKDGMLEMLRVIREQEPTKPSTKLSTAEGLPTLAANRGTEPAKLTKLVRGELDLLVMKALEKDRSRRYETASSFAADVERYLADEPVQACPPSAAYRLRKFVRRHRGPVLAASLVVLALLIAIVGTTGGMLRAIVAEGKAVNEGKQKELALKDREAALVKAQDRLFLALVNRARAERRSGRVGRRFNALAAIRQAAQIRVTPELRTEAAAALVLPDVEVAQEWEAFPEGSLAVAFDANFQRYVRLDDQGGLTVCRLNAGREEVVARLPAHGKPPFGGPWMSADGRFAAYGHGSPGVGQLSEVRVWKLNGAGSAVLLDDRNGKHQAALAFHPAGRQLAIGHADQSVSVYDLATGQRVHRLAVATAPHHLAFHPHESRLAVAGGSAVQLFDTETGQELPALRHPAAVTWTQSVAWHPAGRRLAVGCNDQKIHVWDTQIGAEIMAPWPSGADGISVNYNAAGDRLMSVDWGGQGLWDAVNGRLLLTIPSYIGPQFSQDDELLGYSTSGTKIQLWRLANGRELRVLRRRNADDRERIQNPVLHGDGRTLAACSEHWLSFFDLASGEELTALRLPRAEAAFPVFFNPPGDSRSPDQGLAGEYAGGWVTAGRSGLFLWPTRPDPASSPVLSVGPPKPLAEGVASWVAHGASASADRRIVAVPQVDHSIVLNRDHPDRRLVLGPQFDVRFTTVSPDGRWVVTCSHWARSKCALIWDAASGEQVHELPLADSTFARFSPDGRWLMTSTVNLGSRLWEVGVWSEVRRYDYARFAFSPDSRLLAIADVYGTIRLVETTTGREVARLTAPEPMWLHPECFTPDGTRLIAASSGFTSLYVWDLRLLRAELKELGLDWNWPEFKPEGGGWPAPLAGPPREIRAVGAELLEAAEHKD